MAATNKIQGRNGGGSIADEVDANARVKVRVGGLAPVSYLRRTLNLVDSASVTWSITDDAVNERVDIEAVSTGSGAALSDDTPEPLGVADPGVSPDASRSDHVHVMPSAADVGATTAGQVILYVASLVGSTLQAWSAKLDALAALVWGADTFPYFTSASAVATASITATGRAIVAVASIALGDLLYGSGADTVAKLAGNTTVTRKFLRSAGVAGVATAPAWDTLVAGDLPAATTLAQGAVQLAGDLGGTAGAPQVLKIHESAGPTALTFGAIADGQTLKRVGTTIVGAYVATFVLAGPGLSFVTGAYSTNLGTGTTYIP